MLDIAAINKHAKKYEKQMVAFLRDMIAIPSESAGEKKVIQRIKQELQATKAYDKIRIDGMGNLHATIGKGPRLIAIDAHVDTVGVEPRSEWKHDPYKGKLTKTHVFGRGAGDQEGAAAAMVYAGKIIKDLGMKSDEWTLLLTFTTMEEDCDGLCWQYIVEEEGIKPECVVVTDSTNCTILRGHRARMEIGVWTTGRSCHGSMPEKGDNAIYRMSRIVGEIEKLNDRLHKDKFLGKGTITVSYIDCETPSMCRGILNTELAIWTFVDREGVELTDNVAERAVRPAVISRKTSYGTQSERGSRFAEQMLTCSATLKCAGRSLSAFINDVAHAVIAGGPLP